MLSALRLVNLGISAIRLGSPVTPLPAPGNIIDDQERCHGLLSNCDFMKDWKAAIPEITVSKGQQITSKYRAC